MVCRQSVSVAVAVIVGGDSGGGPARNMACFSPINSTRKYVYMISFPSSLSCRAFFTGLSVLTCVVGALLLCEAEAN